MSTPEALRSAENLEWWINNTNMPGADIAAAARAAAELRRQHAEIDRLHGVNSGLRTVMIAAAEEIHEHWAAHCDAEGYGPANLMRRLEDGIPAEYGYTAGAFARLTADHSALLDTCRLQTAEVRGLSEQVAELTAERDALKLTVERLQQHNTTTWNAGHTLGVMAGQKALAQAQDALKRDAWGNTQLTEALLSAEAERDALRAALDIVAAEVGKLPTIRAPEIDGEESDGTPRYWRDRPHVSQTKVLRLLDAARAALAQGKEPGNPKGLARSDADYWIRSRAAILQAIADRGFMLVSNKDGFRLMEAGKMQAQPKEPSNG